MPEKQKISMKKAQWILYDQCNLGYIEPWVSDIFFVLFTGSRISSPVGDLTFNIRSQIAEYAITRSFLAECEKLGYRTHWFETISYREGIKEFVAKTGITDIVSMRSSEEYLARKIEKYILPWVSLQIFPNRQFLINSEEFREQFEKPPIMETFYRYMRKSRKILMEQDGKPLGGKWNYDQENRNFDKTHISSWSWKVKEIEYLEEAKRYFGLEDIEFSLPVTRSDALSSSVFSRISLCWLRKTRRCDVPRWHESTSLHALDCDQFLTSLSPRSHRSSTRMACTTFECRRIHPADPRMARVYEAVLSLLLWLAL